MCVRAPMVWARQMYDIKYVLDQWYADVEDNGHIESV